MSDLLSQGKSIKRGEIYEIAQRPVEEKGMLLKKLSEAFEVPEIPDSSDSQDLKVPHESSSDCENPETITKVSNGFRKVLVVQSNHMNEKEKTIIVADITAKVKRTFMASHVELPPRFGLMEESMVMLERLEMVNVDDLVAYVGTVNDKEILNKIEIGLRDVFALSIRKQIKGDVRCLCTACADRLRVRNLYFIKRIDSFERDRYMCETCGSFGNRYLVARQQYEKPVKAKKSSRKGRVS